MLTDKGVNDRKQSASHLTAAIGALLQQLPVLVEQFAGNANDAMRFVTTEESRHLVRAIHTGALKLAHSTSTVQDPSSGRFVGQLRLQDIPKGVALAPAALLAFQLASAVTLQYYLHQINQSLTAIGAGVDRANHSLEQRLIDGIRGQEDLLAQIVTLLAAGGVPTESILRRLRDIEASTTPLALELVSQVEHDLAEIRRVGTALAHRVDKAPLRPMTRSRPEAPRLTRFTGTAQHAAALTGDIAKRSFTTARSGELRKDLNDVGKRVGSTEALLAAALRAVSVRGFAGLMANRLDLSQPTEATTAEGAAIQQWLGDVYARLAHAAQLPWIEATDDQLARLFVGQAAEEGLIIALRPRIRALESHVTGLAAAIASMTSNTIHYEIAA